MISAKWSPQIARAMHELSNATPAAPTVAHLRSRQVSPTRQPRLAVTLAAATIAVAAVVGLAFTFDTTSSPEPANSPQPTVETTPVNDGVLLPDPLTSSVTVVSNQTHAAFSHTGGAVLAPDYTVFGFSVDRPGLGEPNPDAVTRVVQGYEVKAIPDGSAPTEIYRTIVTACATLTITTADEDAWSENTLALIAAVTVDGPRVSVALLAGWSDLGSSPARPQRVTELSVDSQGQAVQLFLQQMAGVPAGYFLSTVETAPRAIDLDGSIAWLVAGATTPGWHSIIGERDGIGFSLSGMLSPDELTEIARSLRTTNGSVKESIDGVTETMADPPRDESNECGEPSLTITPFVPVVPAAQQDAVSDGYVTVDEYEVAFSAFVACAEERGGEVMRYSNNSFTGEILYGTGGDLLAIGQTGGSVENECYQEYFAQIEVIFSTTNAQVISNLDEEQMAFFNKIIKPCLVSVGVEIPDILVVASDEWSRLLDENTKAHQDGFCGGTSDTITTSPGSG